MTAPGPAMLSSLLPIARSAAQVSCHQLCGSVHRTPLQVAMCLRLDGTSRWQSSGVTLGSIATDSGTTTATCTLTNLDSQAVVVAQYTVPQQGGPGGSGPANVTVRVTQLEFTLRLPGFTPENFTDTARAQYIAALKQAAGGEPVLGWPSVGRCLAAKQSWVWSENSQSCPPLASSIMSTAPRLR